MPLVKSTSIEGVSLPKVQLGPSHFRSEIAAQDLACVQNWCGPLESQRDSASPLNVKPAGQFVHEIRALSPTERSITDADVGIPETTTTTTLRHKRGVSCLNVVLRGSQLFQSTSAHICANTSDATAGAFSRALSKTVMLAALPI